MNINMDRKQAGENRKKNKFIYFIKKVQNLIKGYINFYQDFKIIY